MARKLPFRFWIAALVFYSTFTNYAMRVNLSVSILAMRKIPTKEAVVAVCEQENGDARPTEATEKDSTEVAPEEPDEGIFKKQEFSELVNGQLLSSYGYGYILSSIPGGFFAEYFGPFKTLFWANLLSAIFTALCVPAALLHWSGVFICRFAIGALGGVVYPALQILISRWAPKNEKGKFVSALMGNTLGTAIVFPLVGIISDASNWAWGFFFVAIFALIYVVVIYIFLSDSPEKSKFTSAEEKAFLAEEVPPPKLKMVAPYKKILTSIRFWALACCHFANLYGLFIILLSTPQFFVKYLGFNLKKSGALSAMPPLLRLFTGIIFGIIGDAVIKAEPCSKNIIRKSFLIFSHYLPAICLISIMFCGCNYILATVFLTLAQGFNAAVVLTNLQNPQDLAPNYAGTIFGIISVIGGVSQFIVPTVTAALTANGNTLKEWKWVFILGGSIYFTGATIFVIFASAEIQSWNEPQPEPDK